MQAGYRGDNEDSKQSSNDTIEIHESGDADVMLYLAHAQDVWILSTQRPLYPQKCMTICDHFRVIGITRVGQPMYWTALDGAKDAKGKTWSIRVATFLV
jgi:hypothetical protein